MSVDQLVSRQAVMRAERWAVWRVERRVGRLAVTKALTMAVTLDSLVPMSAEYLVVHLENY